MNPSMTNPLEGLSIERQREIRRELSKAKKKVQECLLQHRPIPSKPIYRRAIKAFEASMLILYANMCCLSHAELEASMESIRSEACQIATRFYIEMGLGCDA